MVFLLFLMATFSSLFADEYVDIIKCDGSSGETHYNICFPNFHLSSSSRKYYKLELIEDRSTKYPGCHPSSYQYTGRHGSAVVIASKVCNGTFGLKPISKGYPYQGGCGQDNGIRYKIIHGKWAKQCQFPWMAYVRKGYMKKGITCGGSIIHEKWILTAGHCVITQKGDPNPPPAWAMKVHTGSSNKRYLHIEREVDLIKVHPDYENRHIPHDVALLRLKRPIVFDGCHAPICLNSNKTISLEKTCVISGWGVSGLNPRQTFDELMYTSDTMLPRKTCDELYGRYSNDGTICAKATSNGRSGFCGGDSGGPLVCKGDNGRFFQHGVVSLYWTHAACRIEGVYASVGYYYEWIKKTMREN